MCCSRALVQQQHERVLALTTNTTANVQDEASGGHLCSRTLLPVLPESGAENVGGRDE